MAKVLDKNLGETLIYNHIPWSCIFVNHHKLNYNKLSNKTFTVQTVYTILLHFQWAYAQSEWFAGFSVDYRFIYLFSSEQLSTNSVTLGFQEKVHNLKHNSFETQATHIIWFSKTVCWPPKCWLPKGFLRVSGYFGFWVYPLTTTTALIISCRRVTNLKNLN